MPFFKDKTGALHFLDDASFAHLLPEGSVEITDAEAAELQKPTIDQAKAAKWDAIKAERDRRIASSCVQVNGRWYDLDAESRSRYYALEISSRGKSDEMVLINNWRPADVDLAGSVELTRGLVVQIIGAGIMQVAAIDAAAQAHKAALEVSEDPGGYDYSEGWPQAYAEWSAEQAAASAEA